MGALSVLFMGMIANNYGRKKALIACLIPSSLGVFALGFSTNYTMALLLYGLAGFCIAFLNFAILWLNEIGGNNYRVLANGVIQIGWALFEIIFVIFAYMYKHWRAQISYIAGIPVLITILGFFFIK